MFGEACSFSENEGKNKRLSWRVHASQKISLSAKNLERFVTQQSLISPQYSLQHGDQDGYRQLWARLKISG